MAGPARLTAVVAGVHDRPQHVVELIHELVDGHVAGVVGDSRAEFANRSGDREVLLLDQVVLVGRLRVVGDLSVIGNVDPLLGVAHNPALRQPPDRGVPWNSSDGRTPRPSPRWPTTPG